MLADMPIEPFDTFPKELHVRRKTHMTFITCGIGHTHVKVLKIRLPVWGKDSLKGVNVKTGCNLIMDSTDYLVVRYRAGRGYHDATEQLIVYVSVKMFYQQPIRESGVSPQYHKGYLCGRTETIPPLLVGLWKAYLFNYTLKRKHRMKAAKFTLMKTLTIFFQNIEFCKAQSRMNFWNLLYLRHILVGIFPPFWQSNRIFGGISKDTKKPINSQ